jgi:glycosyltransferase involved in cell wall biosynthesis
MHAISVVIPAYNAARTIAAAVGSVRAQTVPVLEIVVVDDASRDDTAQVLARLAGPDLRLLRNADNRGGAVSRNRGIDAARGDYVALLDADDVWLPAKLERQLAALAGTPNDSFAFSALIQTNEYGEQHRLPRRGPRAGEAIADYMLKSGHVVQTSTLLVPSELARRVRFSAELRRFQDLDFVLRLAAAGAAPLFVDEALVEWRSAPASVSRPTRVSGIDDPAVLDAFWALHAETLTSAQRLGLHVRSLGPGPGARQQLAWLGTWAGAVMTGALALPNALSLLLKHSLGLRAYGNLRRHLGMR